MIILHYFQLPLIKHTLQLNLNSPTQLLTREKKGKMLILVPVTLYKAPACLDRGETTNIRRWFIVMYLNISHTK